MLSDLLKKTGVIAAFVKVNVFRRNSWKNGWD